MPRAGTTLAGINAGVWLTEVRARVWYGRASPSDNAMLDTLSSALDTDAHERSSSQRQNTPAVFDLATSTPCIILPAPSEMDSTQFENTVQQVRPRTRT